MFENELRKLVIDVAQAQDKIERIRQLLNEQIHFNLKDLYMAVCGRSAMATAYHFHVFLHEKQSAVDLCSLESMIKGYNNCTSMNLTFMEFSLIFLSKENKLLAKLALQRDSHGNIPTYLLDYARKILEAECQLHGKLITFRQSFSFQAEEWIKKNSFMNQNTDIEEFDQSVLEDICQQIETNPEFLLRYFSVSDGEKIKKAKMLALLTLKNCENIQKYLKKSKNKKQHQKKFFEPGQHIDPYIRPQFQDCLERPKTTDLFSFRQVKSIQKHLDRLNSKNKYELTEKISNYRKTVEKSLVQTCQAIKQILWLEKQIQFQRIQLCLCTDFYPVLFFQSMERDRNGLLIPSALQDYLQKMGVSISLSQLYLLFKRFSNRVDGKLHFNQFCALFDVCNTDYTRIEKNRQIKGLVDVELETKKHFLKLIKIIVKNELKTEKIKAKLQKKSVNLRDVFSVFDSDEDGFISQLDFRIAWKKFLIMELPQEEIELYWHRMKANPDSDTMIKYDQFVSELIPKCKWVLKEQKRAKSKLKGKK